MRKKKSQLTMVFSTKLVGYLTILVNSAKSSNYTTEYFVSKRKGNKMNQLTY